MDLVMKNKPDSRQYSLQNNSPSVDSNNNTNPSSNSSSNNNKCRSLVCDSSGIIIAEMVYRCMICYYVTDSITEAKDHYTMVHMQEDEEEEDEGSNNNHAVSSPPAESMRFASGSSPASGRILQRNPLIPDISLYEDNSGLPLKFSSTSHHLNNSLRQLTNHSNLKNSAAAGLLAAASAIAGHASHLTNGSSSGTSSNSSGNTKSGYVNCAVCGVTRFYSCVQRRYGQFTCVTCYRYFRTFLLKPKRYACPNLGGCPLNVRTRCRACWIKGCISVFSVDSRRQQVLQANFPVKKLTTGSSPSKIPGLGLTGSSAASLAGMLSAQLQQQHNAIFGQNGRHRDDDLDEEQDVANGSSPSAHDRNGVDGEEDLDDENGIDNEDNEKDSQGFDAVSMLEPEVSLTENVDEDNDADIDTSNADMNDSKSFTHSSFNSNQYSPVGKSGGVGLPPHQLNKLIVTGKKVWSCGKCMTCTAEDCGKCIYCLDRPKFGGPFIKKQRCIKRRCLMKIKNNKHAANTLLLRK